MICSRITLQRFPGLLHLTTPLVFGGFLPFFYFSHFVFTTNDVFFTSKSRGNGQNWFFWLPQGSRLLLPIFCKATLGIRSTCAATKENTKKHKKLLFFAKNLSFIRSKAFLRMSWHCKKCHWPASTIPLGKNVQTQSFREPWPIWTTLLFKGDVPLPRNFSTPRPAKDLRLGPLAPSALALTVQSKIVPFVRLFAKRETTNRNTKLRPYVALLEYGCSSIGSSKS